MTMKLDAKMRMGGGVCALLVVPAQSQRVSTGEKL